jgi:hypothetical protein
MMGSRTSIKAVLPAVLSESQPEVNIDLLKFKEIYDINVISSDFFENFFNAFKANAQDSINLNYVSEDETIIDSSVIDFILFSKQ